MARMAGNPTAETRRMAHSLSRAGGFAMDAFELYYRQADADGDGKISGAEAVSFFKGTDLPQILLAKIWQYADQARQGFLTRDQFVYALKLVTVAQSGRDLTPEIARALVGPASLQIPAPRVGQASPQPQSPLYGPPPRSNVPEQKAPASDVPPRPAVSSQQPQQSWRPQAFHAAGSGLPTSSVGAVSGPDLSSGSGTPAVQAPAPVPGPSVPSNSVFQGNRGSVTTTTATANGSWVSTRGLNTTDVFGGDAFKASAPAPSRPVLPDSFSNEASRSAIVPVSVASPTPQVLVSPRIPASFVSPPSLSPTPQVPALPGVAAVRAFAPGPIQPLPGTPWPKMSPSDVQRYSRVFTDADTDRDGKIRGDQARDLFLSWRLPRDVLKQIWDLSDQDGDSMLSFQEFCIALYFMERYREGRPVPPVLPPNFLPDGSLSQPWAAAPVGETPQRSVLPGSESAGLMPLQASPSDTAPTKAVEYKSKAPPLELQIVNQLNRDDQETLKSKYKEAEEADKKVFELDKDIADARAKIDFYRAKLQEIILFKTRSDNQLLEITERVAADKREVELLRRRYDLKFQQAGETNSRLLAEEAAFRDLQQRKMELYNAIAKMEKGQNPEELQDRADQISSDLNDLRNLLNQRAKGMGLRTKPTSAMELPFGWQPGIQEKAADWDEWEKFDAEGFVYFQKAEEPESKAAIAKPTTEGTNEKPEVEPTASSSEKTEQAPTEKPEQLTAPTPKEKQRETSNEKEAERTSAAQVASTWDSVFSDEDFAKPGGLMGLKSIKTSDVKKPTVDEPVPETPLFKSEEDGQHPQPAPQPQPQQNATSESVPETPLFKAETGGSGSQDFFAVFDDDHNLNNSSSSKAGDESVPDTPLFKAEGSSSSSSRAGDESVPDTPLFKAEGSSSSSRSPFALFDSFNSFAYPTAGAAAASTAAATFDDAPTSKASDHRQSSGFSDDWSTFS